MSGGFFWNEYSDVKVLVLDVEILNVPQIKDKIELADLVFTYDGKTIKNRLFTYTKR